MEDPNLPPNLAPKAIKTPLPTPQAPTAAGSGGAAPPVSATARKKRKLGASANLDSHESKYSQIRTLLKDLRPAFIKILRTPDYRNSIHALEICAGMRSMMKLCKQLRSETCMVAKNKRPLEGTSAAESVDNQSNKRQKEDTTQETSQGTSIIGGSPIGWNFIWYMKTETKATSTA